MGFGGNILPWLLLIVFLNRPLGTWVSDNYRFKCQFLSLVLSNRCFIPEFSLSFVVFWFWWLVNPLFQQDDSAGILVVCMTSGILGFWETGRLVWPLRFWYQCGFCKAGSFCLSSGPGCLEASCYWEKSG